MSKAPSPPILRLATPEQQARLDALGRKVAALDRRLKENPPEVEKKKLTAELDYEKLPPGVLKEAVTSGRLVYDIQPAWEAERAVIWDMFKVAVDIGYLPKLPDEGAIYKP